MPTNQFITISSPNSNNKVDLEVPAEEPIQSFLPDLIKVINWPEALGGASVDYQLVNETGQKLDGAKSLSAQGVDNFEILQLEMQNGAMADITALQSEMHPDENARRGDLPLPPAWAGIPIDAPSLVSSQGFVFVLGEPPVTIGRTSREFKPNIDLTELDAKLLSSRHHAEIFKEGKDFLLRAQATTNGTFINGAELKPGEEKVLKDSDRIQFGFRGVELVFRLQ